MASTLYATPYNFDARGFYFTNFEDYLEKSSNNFDHYGALVDEYEIQLIDSDDTELFLKCDINQATLPLWFEQVECLDDYEKINLFYLLNNGYNLSSALDKMEEPCIMECSLKDAAAELFDGCYLHSIPENIKSYIDYDRFARDCELSGDMTEFEYAGITYTCTNASAI